MFPGNKKARFEVSRIELSPRHKVTSRVVNIHIAYKIHGLSIMSC